MALSKTRVLIVDDERFFREAICEVLRSHGFESESCEDGETAVEYATHGDFGVVILDIRLPGIDGIEVLRQIRQTSPALRVIMLSASTDQELVLEALRLGACDYLAKPLHDEELALAVRRATESHEVAHDWRDLRDRLDTLVQRMEALTAETEGAAPEDREAIIQRGAAAVTAEVLGARKTSLMLLDDDVLNVVAVVGRELAPGQMDSVPLGRGIAGRALEHSTPRVVDHIDAEDGHAVDLDPDRYETESFVVAPLEVAGQKIGVLCATDRAGDGSFAASDLSLLRLISLQIAEWLSAGQRPGIEPPLEASGTDQDADLEFISNDEPMSLDFAREVADAAEICSDASDRDAELARQICDAVVCELQPESVLSAVIRPIERALKADPVAIYLIDSQSRGGGAGGRPQLVLEASSDRGLRLEQDRIPSDRGLSGAVFQSGHLIATPDPTADPRFDPAIDCPADQKPGPLLCIPLQLRGKGVGLCRIHLGPGAEVSARTGEVLVSVLSAAIRTVLLYRRLLESIEEVAAARRDARNS